ncbi:MAG: alkylhydroperoxidase [Calditrichaeota bacterium]|nr:MAG: alkylhydroperoxidase [Calditrichota bacterium]MBL1206433.1 alkylhydroperoxidase [Calditrichota bacterium]NOG46260.1 peroxidase-related enzyme [Calditrichota bacterium]
MSWIKIIEYDQADNHLKAIYDKVKGADGAIDNILKAHSLRPHTLTGHMALYKNVLHNLNNLLPKWYLETIGVYVSILNKCGYCVDHHFAGLQRLIKNENDWDAAKINKCLKADSPQQYFKSKLLAGLEYAKVLTLTPAKIEKNRIDEMRKSGLSDGEILEINQVTAYFNYANRTVLGLGIETDGEQLGLSPNDSNDPNNWEHR